MGKGDISGWLPSPGVAPRGGRIPLAAEKRRGRFTVLNNSKWVGSSVHREEGCSLWETDSKAASCRWGCLRFLICPEQTGFGAPSSLDALFAPINVKSEPKGGYKKATRVGGDDFNGFRGGPCGTEHYFLPRPRELDCSRVIPARWRKGACHRGRPDKVLRDSVWLKKCLFRARQMKLFFYLDVILFFS